MHKKVSLLDDMEYLPSLKLLDWNSYPRKRLPPKFRPECLIELRMQFSKLEKLWGGVQVGPLLIYIYVSDMIQPKFNNNLHLICCVAACKSQEDRFELFLQVERDPKSFGNSKSRDTETCIL